MTAVERCKRCSGEGVIDVNGQFVECTCAIVKRLSNTLPAEIRTVPVMKAHADLPITDMVNRSLFVRATDADFRAVLKAAVLKKNGLHVRVTNDMEIRNVGVGSTSRRARGDDAKDVYNDYYDLMESPPLVVVWLNKLRYKNKAAPDFLLEALSVRFDKRKPTWVVSNLDSPFGQGSCAYSDAVWSFLHTAFARVEIPRIMRFDETGMAIPVGAVPEPPQAPRRAEPKLDVEFEGSQQAAPEEPPKKEEAPPRKRRPTLEERVAVEDGEAPEGMGGMGSGNKKKSFQRRH